VTALQGSGKSHSTATLLESCLISDPRIGTLPAPLSGLVCVSLLPTFYQTLITCPTYSFHFDSAAGGNAVQPSEAAYVASLDASRGGVACAPNVVVLVLWVCFYFIKHS
jgi:hypothetical protein